VFGRWVKPVALVAKQLAARLVFLSTLIILLPLAVLNRQTVSIALNPMDLLRDVPHGRLEMPLFIALFALFILGLLAGWLMGRLGQNRRRPRHRSGARFRHFWLAQLSCRASHVSL
jgi:uncharacterized integral membrane protein